MLLDKEQPGTVANMDWRRDISVTASIPGRYTLADHRSARGERREFSCRAVNVSGTALVLAAPVTGDLRERVIAHIDGLGRIEGAIIRNFSRGFTMSITATEDERCKLLDRIEWIEKHKNHDASEQRAHGRFMPVNPYSRLMLADGTVMTCLVIDLSETGAAVSADLDPEIGTVCAVGTIVCRVIRRFVGGFAVRYVEPQDRRNVEAMVIVND